jgi:hypothetical protein
MTSLTLATIAIVVYGVLNKRGYGRALALAGVTASGSAAVVGIIAVPTFYAVALGTAVALGLQPLGSGAIPSNPRRPLPGPLWLLVFFLLWSLLVTLLAPALFNGMTVHVPSGATKLAIGYFTTSNVAQIIYLALGVCVVWFLARSSKPGPELIGLVTGTATLLSLWRYLNQLIGLPFPEGLFDNSPAFAYIESAPDDVERFRGIFSEPSGLAGLSLVTIAYMLPRSFQLRGGRRVGALLTAGTAAYLGAISTSATFVVAGVAVGLIAGVTFALRFLLRRTSVSVLASVAGCALVIGALWFLPILAGFVETTVNQKVGSASFSERSATNDAALDVFVNTFGFGVGLGSNRASSFVPGLLSTTGIVGTIVFATAVAVLIQRASAVREYRPVIWAVVTLLVAKVVAGPDLNDTSGVMWISLGLLSAAASNVGDSGVRGASPLVTDLSTPATRSGGKPWADLESE